MALVKLLFNVKSVITESPNTVSFENNLETFLMVLANFRIPITSTLMTQFPLVQTHLVVFFMRKLKANLISRKLIKLEKKLIMPPIGLIQLQLRPRKQQSLNLSGPTAVK